MIYAWPNRPPKLGFALAITVLGVAMPFVLYGVWIGRAPSIPASTASQLVMEQKAVLVDIGAASDLAVYLTNAVKWPRACILEIHSASDLPSSLRGHKLLLICTSGIRSASAAMHLRRIGVDAVSVRGGAQQYVCAVPGCSRSILLRSDRLSDAKIPAFRESPIYEQWAVVASFFGIKSVYSLMALGIVLMLWRRRETDLSIIRWSMIFFFIGEAFCFFNVMVFSEDSLLLEHLHSVGMVLSLGLACYGLLEGLDARLIHYSGDSRCALTGLCGGCDKRVHAGCALRSLFLVLIPAMALSATLPWCSSFREVAYNTRILGVLHSYRHPIMHQLYELRYLPVMAMILLAGCFLVLWRLERRSIFFSKILFSAALGALGFSWLRLILVASFIDNQVWFAVWEETTELLFVGLVGAVLVLFQRGLLTRQQPHTAEAGA